MPEQLEWERKRVAEKVGGKDYYYSIAPRHEEFCEALQGSRQRSLQVDRFLHLILNGSSFFSSTWCIPGLRLAARVQEEDAEAIIKAKL